MIARSQAVRKRDGADRKTYKVPFHLLDLYLHSAEGFTQHFRFLRDHFYHLCTIAR
jgi:hypothetical protein